MKFVLDNQARRRHDALALLVKSEQRPGFGPPGHHGELIDRPDHDGWLHLIDVLVDNMYGQTRALGVSTIVVYTPQYDAVTNLFVTDDFLATSTLGLCPHLGAAPRASKEKENVLL